MGSQNYIRGPYATWTPLTEKNYTQIEYLTISNCIFNFNDLALLLFRDIRGSQIYARGLCGPCTPLAETFFCAQGEYFTITNIIFNFNFLALVVSEILGGSQIYTRGPTHPGRSLAENCSYAK